jgi:hypothetical protein
MLPHVLLEVDIPCGQLSRWLKAKSDKNWVGDQEYLMKYLDHFMKRTRVGIPD